MPRPPRNELDDGLYHITSNAVADADLYRDDRDCEVFLGVLDTAVRRFRWICHAYCLMTTHFHLLIETREPNLARGMQWLNSAYAIRFNKRHSRRGHVFQARYHPVPIVREAHLLEVARYIVLNPVRAGLCRDAAGWKWSSSRATAGLEWVPGFLTVGDILVEFSNRPDEARAAYRDFVADGIRVASLAGALALSTPASDPGQTPSGECYQTVP